MTDEIRNCARPELLVDDPFLKRVYSSWNMKRGERLMPSRADVELNLIPDILPHLFIVDVLSLPRRYRVRLAGSDVVTEYGEEITGRLMDELDFDERSMPILQDYDRACRERQPVATRWNYTKHSGRHLTYERLILPLADDGVKVDCLLCVATGHGSIIGLAHDRLASSRTPPEHRRRAHSGPHDIEQANIAERALPAAVGREP
jgi:hypothetical protein